MYANDWTDKELLSYLRAIKTGKAADPYAGITDYIRSLGLSYNRGDGRHPYLQLVSRFLKLFETNSIPASVNHLFTSIFDTFQRVAHQSQEKAPYRRRR